MTRVGALESRGSKIDCYDDPLDVDIAVLDGGVGPSDALAAGSDGDQVQVHPGRLGEQP